MHQLNIMNCVQTFCVTDLHVLSMCCTVYGYMRILYLVGDELVLKGCESPAYSVADICDVSAMPSCDSARKMIVHVK